MDESYSIFVVDDDHSVRTSLTRLFRSAGWRVEGFDDAQAFLARLPLQQPGCVVLDVSMPGMHGPELHEQLLKRGCQLPVIFLTGHGDVPTSVRQMKRGAVDFLLKPADDKLLLQTVEAALEKYSAVQAYRHQQDKAAEHLQLLTSRERQVLDCMLKGYINKQTAAVLGIAEKTVKVHRAHTMEKMQVHSVPQLVYACELAGVRGLEPAPESFQDPNDPTQTARREP